MDNCHLIAQVLLTFAESFQKHRTDISALIITPDKHIWLGSDETSTIERLSLTDTNNFADHQHFRVAEFIDLPAPESEEIDLEGFAYAGYYLWFVGSHSYKRQKPKSKYNDVKNIQRLATIKSESNRYILGRIPLVDGKLFSSGPHPQNPDVQLTAAKLELTDQGNLLITALMDDSHLGIYIKAAIPGKDNGFDIEGISISQNRIFLGLRGPVLRGWAVILEIELEDSTLGLMTLKSIGEENKKYKKHFLWLNGLGIRDLYLDGEDLLILAGPTMDLDGPVQVYRWQGGVNSGDEVLSYPDLLQDIPYGNGEDHAEGMTLFNDVIGNPSLLVVYDSPAKKRLVGDTGVLADVFNLG